MRKRKDKIINGEINNIIDSIGHFQKLVICDCGLPIPNHIKTINLALTENIPSFLDVFNLLIEEMDVEKIILADEMKVENKILNDQIEEKLEQSKIESEYVTHELLKEKTRDAYCFIKTGEATVFANAIIVAGVNFKKGDY